MAAKKKAKTGPLTKREKKAVTKALDAVEKVIDQMNVVSHTVDSAVITLRQQLRDEKLKRKKAEALLTQALSLHGPETMFGQLLRQYFGIA
jgi:transcription initiation factor TFIIIB Brf1 subunit/transcription initiation factor TFIIB